LAEAEFFYGRILSIDEEKLGPEHPNVARDLSNYAGFLQQTNRLPEAELLFRRALAIDQKVFGLNHAEMGNDLNNLAGLESN
jgi:hypothetical protein